MAEKSLKSRSRKKEQPLAQVELPLRASPENRERSDDQRYLFLTNRNNLLDILSSGWIRPASKYKKYYNDSGSMCPKAIPLLATDPSSDFVQVLSSPDPGIFPVLLDLDLQDMSGEIQIIASTYQTECGRLPLQKEAIGIVVEGIIPASCIKCIYFRSSTEREDHESTIYKNIRSGDYPLFVAPGRFNGASVDIDLLQQAFRQAGQQLPDPDTDLFPGAEALGGALVLLGGLSVCDPRLSLQELQSILMMLWQHAPAQDATPGLSDARSDLVKYLDLLPALLLDGIKKGPTAEAEANQLPAGIIQYIMQSNFSADLFFFSLAVQTLMNTGLENYFNEEILDHIKSAWEHLPSGYISGEMHETYLRYIDSIQDVLRNKVDLANFPTNRSLASTAMLLFLLRSRPEQILSWIEEKPRPAPDILALAATLTGVLTGRSLLPVSVRADGIFEKYVDRVLAWKLNTVHHGVIASVLPPPPQIETIGDREILKSSGLVLIQHTRQLDRANTFVEPFSSSQDTRPLEQASEKRPPNLSEEDPLLMRLLEEDLKEEWIKAAALYLCEVANWEECVTTIILLERRRFSLNHRPELRVAGFLKTPLEVIIHVDRFRRRLTHEAWHDFPDEVKERVKRIFKGTI